RKPPARRPQNVQTESHSKAVGPSSTTDRKPKSVVDRTFEPQSPGPQQNAPDALPPPPSVAQPSQAAPPKPDGHRNDIIGYYGTDANGRRVFIPLKPQSRP